MPLDAVNLDKHMINDTKQLIDANEEVFAGKASQMRHEGLPSSDFEDLS